MLGRLKQFYSSHEIFDGEATVGIIVYKLKNYNQSACVAVRGSVS
jgi:hypothetical protein